MASSTQLADERSLDGGYMLCCSPRSGSTLLCDLLRQSGVAGAPESFFRPASVSAYASTWEVPLSGQSWDRAYLQAVRHHGSGGTSCFGMRIMWSDVEAFSARLSQIYPNEVNGVELLRSALGIEKFVYLSRDDKVGQAVSLAIAKQTGLWHLNADGSERQRANPPKLPEYDQQQTADELRMLETEAAGWGIWFEENRIEPMRVTYEELAADPVGTLEAVIEFMNGATPLAVAEGTLKTANDTSRAWADRFRLEVSASD